MTGTKEALARLENRLLTKYEANLSIDQARYILGDLPKLSGAEIFLTLPADSCVRCETTATRRQNESPSSQEICRPIRYPSVHGRDKRQVRPTRKSEMLSDMIWPVSLNDGLINGALTTAEQTIREEILVGLLTGQRWAVTGFLEIAVKAVKTRWATRK